MKFLVFNNKNGLGTADRLIVNWDSVKYIKPIDGDTFYIELNNGAYLEFDLSGANTSPKAIEAINRVVKANPNSRILEVKPREINEFVFSNIQYRVAASGSIDGSGTANQVAVFTDPNTISSISSGTSGQVLVSNGAGSDPSFQAAPTPELTKEFFADIFSVGGPDMPIFALDNGSFKGYDIGIFPDTPYIQATTLDQGFNQLVSLVEPTIWFNFPTPFVFVAGSHPNASPQPYTNYPTYFNPFYNNDGQWAGQSWPDIIVLATPTYTYNTYMTPRGWTPTLANTFATDTRLHGVVYCANGVVTFFDKRAVEFDGTSLSDGSEWWCDTRQVQVNQGGQNYIEVVAFFGGNTADVTLIT